MFLKRDVKGAIFLVFCTMIALCALVGCAQHNYKAEADEQVYGIIDRKWKDDFGAKVNYKVSDTEPASSAIQIEKAVPSGGVLTLPHAVALATAHNREYQTQRELLYNAALDLRLVRHQFETQFFGGPGAGYARDWNDEVFLTEVGLGFNRLLAMGTMITTDLSLAYADVLVGNMQSGLASVLTATVTQPLLRGSDPAVVLEDLTQAERTALYQVRSFNRFRKTFVVSVVTQYYQLLKLHDLMENAQANYETLVWLSARVEKLTKVGRLAKLEYERMHQEMLQARDTYIQAQKEYETALDQFKLTLSLPTTTEFALDAAALDSLKMPDVSELDFDEAQAIETALVRRLDVANSADAVADAKRKVYVAADALRADLNLTGTVDVVSGQPGGRDLQQVTEDYTLDLNLDLPLDRVPEQAVYRKALLTLNQSKRDYDLATDTVAGQVRQAFRDLCEAAQRHQVQSEAVELAQERFRKNCLLMQYGRASSRRVLDAQRAFFDAQNEATETLVNYTVAMLNFYRDTGVLQVRADGMWQH
jgi:outer membrane protein TolC